jgi:L-fuculose-phosphate aldolase
MASSSGRRGVRAAKAEAALRLAVVNAAQSLNEGGLNVGKSGNVSARAQGGFLVTPSAVPYEELAPARIVFLDDAGQPWPGQGTPSSEWRIHCDIYRQRPEVGAVVHVHSPYATALACTRRGIPAFHYLVVVAGGADIRCAPYAPFGTAELSALALTALEGRTACLLGNHGSLSLAATPAAALALAREVESLAQQYCLALGLGGAVLLTPEEIADALERFAAYRRGALAAMATDEK